MQERLLLLLLLILVLFLILLFIFLFLLCASRLSTRQAKVDRPLAARSDSTAQPDGQGSAGGLDLSELPHIPLTPGQTDAIEILADRHSIFAGRAQQVSKVGHGHGRAGAKALDHPAAELGFGVEIEVESR